MLTLTKKEFEENVKKLNKAIKLAERVLKPSSKPIKRTDKVDNLPLPKTQTPYEDVDMRMS